MSRVVAGTGVRAPLRRRTFGALWVLAVLVAGSSVLGDRRLSEPSLVKGLLAVVPLLAANAALLGSSPVLVDALRAASTTRRVRLALVIAAAVLVLFAAGLAGTAVLVPVAAAAVGVLVALRSRPRVRQVRWALVLGVVAAVAGVLDGLAAGSTSSVLFGLLQLPLVVSTLLAGWALADRAGWVAAGVGQTLVLSRDVQAGLRGFFVGVVLGLPWALGNVANGPSVDDMVRTGWQPLATALQPAVAEEAWARVFVLTALFVLFARFARARPALLAAVVVAVVWFAFLHVPANPTSTLLLAAIYVTPMAWLYLQRGLEAAIGFHFTLDLTHFVAAYLAFRGVWFS